MKATITYSLPEEQNEFELYGQGQGMLEALQSIRGGYGVSGFYDWDFRSLLKYDGLDAKVEKAIAAVKDKPSWFGLEPDLTNPDVMAREVAYELFDKMEDANHTLMVEFNINLGVL